MPDLSFTPPGSELSQNKRKSAAHILLTSDAHAHALHDTTHTALSVRVRVRAWFFLSIRGLALTPERHIRQRQRRR
jgi:hypothetical protein